VKALTTIGAPLLDQQCYCFGEDIRRPAGNLLLEHGFVRERAGDRAGCSRYRKALESGSTLTLWGFGAHLQTPDGFGVIVNRQSFEIRLTDAPISDDAWLFGEIETRRFDADDSARASVALAELVGELLEYESWVAENHASWRRSTVSRWFKKRVAAGKIVDSWRRVRDIAAALGTGKES
jgi:hypothetical protein